MFVTGEQVSLDRRWNSCERRKPNILIDTGSFLLSNTNCFNSFEVRGQLLTI